MGITQGSLGAHRFAGLLLIKKSARRSGQFPASLLAVLPVLPTRPEPWLAVLVL